MNSPRTRTTVCTIVSKNYLSYARTLMDSIRAVHPEWSQQVLLVDELHGEFDPRQERFCLTSIADLPLPERRKFCYRYSILELNTAVKPWFLEWIFQNETVDRVIYLDPDIYVYRPFREVEKLLDQGAFMVLTPHITRELNDGRKPSDHDILKAGCYNLGFLALSRSVQLSRFLAWWKSKLEFDCRVALGENLFVDQRWLDLAPALFGNVSVLRHEGYNVAYWNLAHRTIRCTGDGFQVNAAVPLVFFHFSGLNVAAPASLSIHQDRFSLRNIGAAAELVRDYCRVNRKNGFQACRSWNYAMGKLDDGTPIMDAMRHCYRDQPSIQEQVGDDPFAHDHEYLNDSWGTVTTPLVTRLMRQVWQSRPDLQAAFPDIKGAHREAFADWYLHDFAASERVPRRFVESVRESLQVFQAGRAPITNQAEHLARNAVEPPAGYARQSIWAKMRPVLSLMISCLPLSGEQLRSLYWGVRPFRWVAPAGLRQMLKQEIRQWLLGRRQYRRQIWLFRALGNFWQRLVGYARRAFRWKVGPGSHWAAELAEQRTPAADAVVLSHRVTVLDPSTSGERQQTGPPRDQVPHTELEGRATVPLAPARTGTPRSQDSGLNIIGYVRSEHGVGESCRSSARAAQSVGMPFALLDFNTGNFSRTGDDSWSHQLAGHNPYLVNLFHINADQMPLVHAELGQSFLSGHYNIGYWAWELPELPDSWMPACGLVDEVWVPSEFVKRAIQDKFTGPVHCVPHCVKFRVDPAVTRNKMNLPDSPFTFLTMYDTQSYQERKNPQATIQAFCTAFPNARNVSLVVKINNPQANPQEVQRLKTQLAGYANVVVMDRILSRQDVYNLEGLCDCFVSLHRSEGFGLGLAEAMFLGKPVIGTNWSGNCDFMTEENSCPVQFRLIPLERDVGPYPQGQFWADPDIDHAAWYMKRLVAEPLWRTKIAKRGRETIRRYCNPRRVGRIYQRRLVELGYRPGLDLVDAPETAPPKAARKKKSAAKPIASRPIGRAG